MGNIKNITMTNDEQIAFINQYFGSAVDAFTNARMKTILLALSSGSIVASFATGAEFEQAITDSPDMALLAYVADDPVYTGGADVVLWRIPGRGVGQLAIDFITDERI